MLDTLTHYPNCKQQAVRSKTLYLRALNAKMKPEGDTETVLEEECQNCGWITSKPVPTR